PQGNCITVINEDTVQQQVILPDKSEIFLAPGATVSYPPTFSRAQRSVQFEGKGFFDIEKRPEQPFVVRMLNAEVKVLGTSFQIEDNGRQTDVTVTSGKVQLSQRFTGEFVYLEKGESGHIQKETLSKFMTRQKNFDAWHTGYFSFDQAPLDSILLALNTYYGPVFQSDLSSSKPCRLNIQTQAQKPEEIAEIIQLICGLSFSRDNRTITFRK
ncbi:MAG: FecR family protein, partial [Bacteroidota bacterium]